MKQKENLFVSACLCGIKCRYDGNHNLVDKLEEIKKNYNLILFCPEQAGGLSTPRSPSEIKNGRIITKDGRDVTYEFELGANKAFELAKRYRCKKAFLKSKSPSCGYGKIYDGSHRGKLIEGNGILSELFIEYGIKIYTEDKIEELLEK